MIDAEAADMSGILEETLFRCDLGGNRLVIGRRLTLTRFGERNADSRVIDARQLMRQIVHTPGSSAALRRCCAEWGLTTVALWHIDDGELADWLAAQVKRGTLAIARVPDHQIKAGEFEGVEQTRSNVLTSLRAARDRNSGLGNGKAMLAAIAPSVKGTGPQPMPQAGMPAPQESFGAPEPPAPATGPSLNPAQVQAMPLEDRMIEVLHRAVQSDLLSEDAKQQLEQLLSPEAIAATVAVLAVWAGSQAIGIGFFIDMLMLAVGVFSVGMAAIEGARKLADFLSLTVNARNSDDLDKAAEILAAAIVLLGIVVFMTLIAKGMKGVRGASETEGLVKNRGSQTRSIESLEGMEERPASSVGVGSAESAGTESPAITASDIKGKTAQQIRELAKKKGLVEHPRNPNKFKDPVTGKQRIRIDPGHIDRVTGKPYNNPNAARPHVHGYPLGGQKAGKIVDPETNDPHFPLAD